MQLLIYTYLYLYTHIRQTKCVSIIMICSNFFVLPMLVKEGTYILYIQCNIYHCMTNQNLTIKMFIM